MATTVHGTAIAFGDFGVLIQGSPGSGKSSLALQLIDQNGYGLGSELLRPQLVADDQVTILVSPDRIELSPPKTLAGLIEIRGHGIVKAPYREKATLKLIVQLQDASQLERLPEEHQRSMEFHSFLIPVLRLAAQDSASPSRVRAVVSLYGPK
jgi:HPr kinase/phosphorylase